MLMKKITNKYDKNLIADLPRVLFPGHIEVIVSESGAERAVEYLMKQPILGFDTETRPSFTQGKQYKVALLQVCGGGVCFLFRLNYLDLPQCLVKLLEDKKITKVGLSWHDDLNALRKIGEFKTGSFIDIQDHVRELGIEDLSLQKLYANLFGQKISKRQQLSNWEADILNEKQKMYAATDAWACIMIYNEILRLKQSKDYNLITKENE